MEILSAAGVTETLYGVDPCCADYLFSEETIGNAESRGGVKNPFYPGVVLQELTKR
jgi:hypothetical protein